MTSPSATPSDTELLELALDTFARRGYAGTSVREIARALGVSHNFIPQRFGTKERLWFAAVDHGFDTLGREILDALTRSPADDLERLRAVMVRFLTANAARPAMMRIINQEATVDSPRLRHLLRYIDPVVDGTNALLETLHRAGRVRSVSGPQLFFLVTLGASSAFSLDPLARHFGGDIDPADPGAVERYARAVVELLFAGIEST